MKSEHFIAIYRQLERNPSATQRELARFAGLSLGTVNSVIKEAIALGYLAWAAPAAREEKPALTLTPAGQAYLDSFRVKNAVILAAGFGARCVPLTYDTPKGLLPVHGKPMIERQIEQLIEAGITDITIVVGYKKEKFDYLTDQYGARLVYNHEYASKNNLSSIYRVLPLLDSTYLLMSDHFIEDNIFSAYEARSWYSCVYIDGETDEWCVAASPSDKIKSLKIGGRGTWAIVGPAYFSPSFSKKFRQYIDEYYNRPGSADYYWEHILMERIHSLPIYMNRQTGNVHEIENLDELRIFDPSYNEASNNKTLQTIAAVFKVPENEIHDIAPIKVGMTNRSFTFRHGDSRYIMRIPGEGTATLIDRKQERAVYQIVAPLGICDELVYIDAGEGYKITGFIEGAKVCDPLDFKQVGACMRKLREFHELRLEVGHTFDLFERIEFYESLWLEPVSCFRDYAETKANVMKLKEYIDSADKDWTLAHIDAVPDNFLFLGNGEIRLIDWEYAGMQDPHIDIAMFAVYSMYDSKEQVDRLIDCYFAGSGGGRDVEDAVPYGHEFGRCGAGDGARLKIYAYIAACGLLWSNWCEYKSHLGVEFGEYALRQYRFAKDYYRIFCEAHKQGSPQATEWRKA